MEAFFGGPMPAWHLHHGDVANATETGFDRIVLDMLTPWDALDMVERALVPGGVFIGYVATTPQMSERMTSTPSTRSLSLSTKRNEVMSSEAC